ncbi:lysophospholipid acyltransferase family protein [Gemmatimonadota bacterium]
MSEIVQTEMERLPYTGATYHSPPGKPSLLARRFPSFGFYRKLPGIVWRAGFKAKRGRYGDEEWIGSSHDTVRALERAGVYFEITGLDHLEGLGSSCVFIGNHMSVLETFALPGLIRPLMPVTFIVKDSLLTYPVFGHVMRSRDPIAVGRTNPREDLRAVMEGGKERLGNGVSLIIFPQTTRTPAFDPAEFNTLGVKLARRADVPIIPMALLTNAWGTGKRFKDFGKIDPSKRVHLAFGEPFRVEGRGEAEHEAIISFIEGKLKEWGHTALPPTDSREGAS